MNNISSFAVPLPELIAHRVNTLDHLAGLPEELGAEIDIRSRGGELILAHEPHQEGPLLSEFLKVYARTRKDALLILNPKEDGLDVAVRELVAQNALERFFFLDLTYPAIVRSIRDGQGARVALRVSEFETAESAARLAGKAGWVWCDCFTGQAPDRELVRELRKTFKVCLVSPELEGFPAEAIAGFRSLATEVDAVCTKYPQRWD